ncbi:MAG: shikimate dehydrogenase [Hymenobacteraceae bacterium]|nr:shikimate dehydrogenase [Hymenobacteraceae bacterium]MDX5395548.1 shikimate dehydrogenase [Hymenobacteraceae bacterium]MDX5443035.1 shikimate dehydrogenase [Hymenobacteraceae bacterium]MDX5511602.1 shikimate dehydrogenase [Hymenobacteraceae bacterium]
MLKYGLIGQKLGHSFSKSYFTEKFAAEQLVNCEYNLYELTEIASFPNLLKQEPELQGLNVTIPYKQAVIPYLDELDETAKEIGAVNTIKIRNGRTKGYNTDYVGFKQSLLRFCPPETGCKALVLGTGGASKAVQAVLKSLQMPFTLVSRKQAAGVLTYAVVTPEVVNAHCLIINTTPCGMFPDVASAPELPYQALSVRHHLYDLVYNPAVTEFLKHGKVAGASVKNGLEMLYLQAEAAWQIWNS